jgi:hypothetical protein
METKIYLEQLSQEYSKIVNTIEKIENKIFFKKETPKLWSVAENIHHLSLSLFPINTILKDTNLMTLRWGKSNRISRTYNDFLSAYNTSKQGLDWKAFPPFVPKSENENSEYLKMHTTENQNKIDSFYKFTGEQIQDLRNKVVLQTQVEKEEIIKILVFQYQSFLSFSNEIDENQMNDLQIPSPYIGLITLKEMIFFVHNHTKCHRLTIERLIKKID